MLRLLIAAVLPFCSVAAGAQSRVLQTSDEALAQDAAEYARAFDVTPAEAVRRLHAQEESVAFTEAIREFHRDRLVGIVIEHRPTYRIVVLLTGDASVPDMIARAGGSDVPISFRTGASATHDRIVAAIEAHQAQIRADLPHPPAMAVDPREGALVVLVNAADTALVQDDVLRRRWAALTGVPVTVRSMGAVETDLDGVGGGRLEGVSPVDSRRYVCTAGFVVTDGVRTGLATAAHCVDDLAYVEPGQLPQPLTFAGQWGWGYQDVQLNLSDRPLAPMFFADTANATTRPVTGWRNRRATRVGDWVCHRGEHTGYSCAEVVYTDFAPAGDLCGGACLPRWVAARGPSCRGGDSGGPVFLGTTAFGIVKGGSYRPDGSCALFYYMSIDYLPTGWTLLLG